MLELRNHDKWAPNVGKTANILGQLEKPKGHRSGTINSKNNSEKLRCFILKKEVY